MEKLQAYRREKMRSRRRRRRTVGSGITPKSRVHHGLTSGLIYERAPNETVVCCCSWELIGGCSGVRAAGEKSPQTMKVRTSDSRRTFWCWWRIRRRRRSDPLLGAGDLRRTQTLAVCIRRGGAAAGTTTRGSMVRRSPISGEQEARRLARSLESRMCGFWMARTQLHKMC